MSEITPNDLPPINELDEFTAHIPELQIDTDVLAGTDGPANFQAQALANRTQYLKRILDAVSLELNGINHAVAAAQQSADTAKQGADASMKKSANGADIADAAQFRNNVGLQNAMIRGEFGWGGEAVLIPNGTHLMSYFTNGSVQSGLYKCLLPTASPDDNNAYLLVWEKYSEISGSNNFGALTAISLINTTPTVVLNVLDSGVWQGWAVSWDSKNLSPVTTNTAQTITGHKTFQGGNTTFKGGNSIIVEAGSTGSLAYIPFYDAGQANRKGWLGRGRSNQDTVEFFNDVTGAHLQLHETGDIVLNPKAGQIVRVGGSQIVDVGTTQTITGSKTFSTQTSVRGSYPSILLFNTDIPTTTVGHLSRLEINAEGASTLISRNATNTSGQRIITFPKSGSGTALVTGNNAVADANGYWKTASPVINIYADGSFTTTHEAIGVNVERLSEGVYKITGCQGMHSDAAWNGIDGGVSNPKCRNDKALLWNNYEVDEDGSITVHTFHRVHPDAISFAQNRLTLDKEQFDPKKGHKLEDTWPDQAPIDVPKGLFIQVRVNMPERIEPKPAVMHSNVYCNSISPAK
ncbi:hypothetical protein C5E24_06875 [Pectobacterium parmentieri]|uniref:phage tail fiber protein n=1 Tax=Pectobacterium parmentieri TaxID=1905730 RepID=UPI000EAFE4BD|nr:hypothetical protein [Pectobacterium parmentieri]AYH09433.1 hypothetical protein C5E24_06875 [Pectobacterium parmentieri]